jgi:predicted RNA binding protein YcfA (HicA-like mRNA interferase family)
MKARRFRSLLERELGYTAQAGSGGSHRKLKAEGRPQILFAFHDGDEIGPAMVRDILVKQVRLTREEALEVVRRG